ncbi:putative serine carboxypeptidase protein [Neofusicoccum parvum]|nr:putative serine carboxypeptidase protein [Neofusicoccum parvum]
MKLSTALLSALLPFAAANAAAASHRGALHAFQRAEGVKKAFNEKREAAAAAAAPRAAPQLQKRASPFATNATQKFAVDGTKIPDVDFDIGESYAGLLPISDNANETRKLYFWFFPSTNPNATDEITIWFNGGPGCSSLSGLLTENGPFTWESGTYAPVQNPYTWVNLTNMLWVEQPVGVGFSQGEPDITNELELAKEFAGFYKSFVDTFDAHGSKVYITGESYAGFYVPYVANEFLNRNDTDYYNLAGIAINDPIIGDEVLQQEVIVPQYVDFWSNLFFLNDSFVKDIKARADACNYTTYLDTYLTFPPPQEPFPTLPDPYYDESAASCDLWDDVYLAALEVNPCFNIYHITETCPHPYSVLGIVNSGDYSPPGLEVYFNRTDVQAAINAPVGTNWAQCTNKNVFVGQGDQSPGPALDGTLQNVIERTNNVIVGSGNLDYILSTNGTLLALQNLTWNGAQGLQAYPGKPFYSPYHVEYNGGSLAGAGLLGSWGAERGLTFYQTQLAGHELPGYTPGAAYRSIELLLGRIESLSEVGDFTTREGEGTNVNASAAAAAAKVRMRGLGFEWEA